MVAALNAALRDALRADDRVLVFGEDVGRSGGVFRVTDGLQAEFGDRRVFDTPISEAGIVGAAVGLAFAGWRSVVEMQFDAFSYPALEQIVDHVAKMRERTRGRVDMPITIRMPAFGGIKGKEHHGESPETYYVHTAGLKVVAPSNPGDAYRLLRLAIADPDPVIVLEPKARYWAKAETELTTDGPGIGQGAVVREGDAATSSRTARWWRGASTPRRPWPTRASRRGWSTSARCRPSTTTSSPDACARPAGPWSCTRRRGRSGWAPRWPRASWRRRSTSSKPPFAG